MKLLKSVEGKIFSIAVLRCIATVLITNTHFDGIYPISALASGGLLGDVLFFMISGYCLIDSKESNFFKWYGKRILRIYPAVIIMILINLSIGFFKFEKWFTPFDGLVYPTFYNFVGAIMLLYIPFFFIKTFLKDSKKLFITLSVVFLLWVAFYIVFTDKSEYVMNDTGNPVCLFLYFTSMIFGALLKRQKFETKNKKSSIILSFILTVALFAVYAGGLVLIRRTPSVFDFQIIINFVLIALCCLLFTTVLRCENTLCRLPQKLKNVIWYSSGLTLDLYVVQMVIIRQFENLVFPVNFFVTVFCILAAAIILHTVVDLIINSVQGLIKKCNKAKN